MDYIYDKVPNTISIHGLTFEVVSYKLEHVKTVSFYYTLNNTTGMYVQGNKPFVLSLKGYFHKSDGNNISATLESIFNSSDDISFTIAGTLYNQLILNKYIYNENISDVCREAELFFMGNNSFSEVSNSE